MSRRSIYPVVPASPEPLLVPLAEAARLLGVRIYSIRRMTRKGVLPYKLIPFAALKAFASNTKAAA